MNDHALPTLVTVQGTFKFQIYTTADLTVPTIQTIISVGETKESANITLGTSEIGSVKITIRDDATTYKQGFWFKALQSEVWLRIILTEGVTDTFYFFGMVDTGSPDSVNWEEHYIGTTRIRTATITLVSMARKIFDMDIDDWVAEVLAQCTDTEEAAWVSVPSHLIKFKDLFSCMLSASAAPLNPDYDEADASFVRGTAAAITWGDGTSDLEVDEIWIPVKYTESTGPTVTTATHYFNTALDGCLSVQPDGTGYYSSMDALLRDLLGNGCLQMRMDYDVATGRHKIQLMHKTDVYTGVIHFDNRDKSSNISSASRLVGDAVRSVDLMDDTKYNWVSKKYSRFGNESFDPDTRVKFDLEYRLPFIIDATGSGEGNHSFISWDGVGNAIVYISGIKYLNDTGVVTAASTVNKMQEAVSIHTYGRFIVERKNRVRRYGGMYADAGAGDTHTALNIMRRAEISELDDAGAETTSVYYANTVTKNPKTDEVEIEWIEE